MVLLGVKEFYGLKIILKKLTPGRYPVQQKWPKKTASMSTEFNLTCSRRWLTTLFISLGMAGGILGSVASGPILKFMRLRDAMILSRVLSGVCAILTGFCPHLAPIVILRFIMFFMDHLSVNVYQGELKIVKTPLKLLRAFEFFSIIEQKYV